MDQVFSRFSIHLNKNDARTPSALFKELKKAFTPECNFENLKGVLDMKTWFGDALPSSAQVINLSDSYQVYVRASEDGSAGSVNASVFVSKWSDTYISGGEHLLQSIPRGVPLFLAGRYLFSTDKLPSGKSVPLAPRDAEKKFMEVRTEVSKIVDKLHFNLDETNEWKEVFSKLEVQQVESARPSEYFWPESRRAFDQWTNGLGARPDLIQYTMFQDREASAPKKCVELPGM